MVDEKLGDTSSIIRVLNSLHNTKVGVCGETIFFKTKNKTFVKDLEEFAKTYQPLVTMNLHKCGEQCSIEGFYALRVEIIPHKHVEASQKLYELLGKYSK